MADLTGSMHPASMGNPWFAGDGIGLVRCKGRLYRIGGWHRDELVPWPNVSKRVEMALDDGRTWYPLDDAPIAGHTTPLVVLNDEIYMIGGDPNSGFYRTGLWRATPLEWGLRWTLVVPILTPLAQGRVGHVAWAFEGKIIFGFGQTLDELIPDPANKSTKTGSPYYDDLWSYTPGDADAVLLFDNMGIAPFAFMLGSPVMDGSMWLVGGGAYETEGLPRVYGKRVYRGDLTGFELVTLDGGFSPCIYNFVLEHRGELVSAFGYGPGGDKTEISASRTGLDFRQIRNDLISKRHAASAVSTPRGIAVCGGPLFDTTLWYVN